MAYELSWKVLKRTLRDQGHETLGAKDVYSKAYQLGFLDDEGVWLEMIADRNQTSHVSDESEARKIVARIQANYEAALCRLEKSLEQMTDYPPCG